MSRFTFVFHVCRGDFEVELTGEYSVVPYLPATRIDPEEGGHIALESVLCGGEDFELTSVEEDALIDVLTSEANEILAQRADDEAEYRYQSWKDDQMERGE